MRTLLWLLIGGMTFASVARADVTPVAARVPKATAWVGQRVAFYVELRVLGSFAGTATFDLPQVPGTLVIKIGEPVVGSQELEGETWFVQTHEFALFSQRSGSLEIPAFFVRFSRRDGFVGPATEVEAQAEGLVFDIQRPPGTDDIGFLITTESLDVSEAWDPAPGATQVGAMFKRTIVQRAQHVSGMALVPAPTTAPEGIRVYPGDAATHDNLVRGEFLGERRETITYLVQTPGTLVLPALKYVWWNPKTETLQSKTLPAVTFDVAPPPVAPTTEATTATRRPWPWLLAAVLIIGLGAWQRRCIAEWARQYWKRMPPPDRVAARNVRRACRQHDAAAAHAAWIAWRNTQDIAFQPGPELRAAVLGLQRHLFGPASSGEWQGNEFVRVFGERLASMRSDASEASVSVLPLLNPHEGSTL
ncbi:MAG: hypothetical protein MUO77_08435 [Anaerolineales bacterium]|nr:hypothetical protein [Anaerolineales bacterium]